MNIYTKVINGSIGEALATFRRELLKHEGKWIKISVARGKKRRSENQSRFFHGKFVEDATAMFQDKGNDFDEQMTKDILKNLFGSKVPVSMPDGRIEYYAKSTARWTSEEAEVVMQKARAWAAHYDYQLPFPNEHLYQPLGERIDQTKQQA